jgi:cytidylate kinase
MIIAIDGPAGTGKSTVAREVAQKLGFTFFDTGAIYRAVTWLILERKIALDNPEAIEAILVDFPFEIERQKEKIRYLVDGKDVTDLIRTQLVTDAVSAIAALEVVRRKVSSIQQNLAKGLNAVVEGRDTGSILFPDAELKIFLTASLEVRTKRRVEELRNLEMPHISSVVEQSLSARDHKDSTRSIAPLIKPKDAYEIDTSELTIEEVVLEILRLYVHRRTCTP